MSKRKCPPWQSAPSIKRAKEIDEEDPYKLLDKALASSVKPDKTRNVLHWFRSKDLRIEDNRALHAASEQSKDGGALITLYVHSPEDLDWHGTSPARTDLILETLGLMQKRLKKDGIPMYIHTANQRSDLVPDVLKFIKEKDISHVFGNFEYEIDELRRDIKVAKGLKDEKVNFVIKHDQCAVDPGTLTTGSGSAHKVFTPYHKTWLSLMSSKKGAKLLDLLPDPVANSEEKKAACEKLKLFDSTVPKIPSSKDFKDQAERDRIRKLWPAGHDAAKERLEKFLTGNVNDYHNTRSNPGLDSSSRMSAYFSTGSISIRETLAMCRDKNKNSMDFSGSKSAGIAAWVREIVFREFYRQLIQIIPHNSLNLPQNLKMASVKWNEGEEAEANWKKWCEGQTGFPLVDAGMRQLNTEAWMHNRARMNTASLLRTNMLIDYRRGERYFAEHLIDWDMSNNTQGWEPSYTVFNPTTQGQNNDVDGDYIRKWVPELKDVEGKAVFAPYERMDKEAFERLGYPKPCVDWSKTKVQCIEAYKEATATGEH